MYQALYRKWRPKVFEDVIGQEHITETLKKQVSEGRTSHAYMFTGTRGTGKTTCAKILAKAVNCESPENGNPCCKCPACIGIENGNLMEILEIDAASNNGVDQIRALREDAIYAPASVKTRVYIVDEVHMLSSSAFNALLKILEEPPAHLMFILATTEVHKVLPTILSRCQRFSFKRIQPADIERRLLYVAGQENIDLKVDGANLLARLSDGALRDALSLLDQCASTGKTVDAEEILDVLGLAGTIQTAQMMRCIANHDAQAALVLLNQLYSAGKDIGTILSELSDLTRDVLIMHTAPEGGEALLTGAYDMRLLTELKQVFSPNRLIYIASTIQNTTSELYYSLNRKTDAELCILKLCDETLSGDLTALETRIARLEESLSRGAVIREAVVNSVREERREEVLVQKPAEPEDLAPWEEPPVKDSVPEAVSVMEMPEPEPVKSAPVEDDIPWEEPPLSPREMQNAVMNQPKQEEKKEEVKPKNALGKSWWRALMETCKPQISPMYRPFLDMCTGVLEGDLISIYVPDDMTRNRLENDRVKTLLAKEAELAAGIPVRMTYVVGTPPTNSQAENMKNLLNFASQFDNIEIT